MSTGAISYPSTAHSAAQNYPYWDSQNRYMVLPRIAFAAAHPHPSGWWQVRCYGSRPNCPNRLGPYFTLADAQAAMEAHCLLVHYITPPPS